MVAAHHDRAPNFPALHQFIYRQSKFCPLTISKPADSRWVSLEFDPLASKTNPPIEKLIFRKHSQNQVICYLNVGDITRKSHPTERPAAFAEKRTNIRRHETREIIGILYAVIERKGSDVIAVVESDGAHPLKFKHGFDVVSHCVERPLDISLWIVSP